MKNFYIYKIKNIKDGKVYIGQTTSSKGYGNRFYRHKSDLKRNKHSNKHLQNAYNKYGKESFEFEIIHKENADDLSSEQKLKIESKYSIEYDSFNPDRGYNIAPMCGDVLFSSDSQNYFNFCKQFENEKNPAAKLNKEIVLSIINDYKDGVLSTKDVLSKYNISKTTYNGITSGKIWFDYTQFSREAVAGYRTKNGKSDSIETRSCDKNHFSKIPNSVALKIKDMLVSGYKQSDISKELNVTRSIIYGIASGKNWFTITGIQPGQFTSNARYNFNPNNLSDAAIIEIFLSDKNNEKDIMEKYNLKRLCFLRIKNKKTYRHITDKIKQEVK